MPSLKERIKQLENVVTGSAPRNETDEERISNVEMTLFGQQQGGTLLERVMKAQQTAASAAANKQDDWAPANSPPTSFTVPTAAPTAVVPPPASAAPAVTTPATLPPLPDTSKIDNTPAVTTPTASAVAPKPDSTGDDGWPTALPRLDAGTPANRGPFKVEVSETATVEKIVDEYKKRADAEVFSAAQSYFQNHNYAVAERLNLLLADRHPKFARYFYEAGQAEVAQDHVDDAFANYALAWHLGHADAYTKTAEQIVPVLQRQIDPDFKLTYEWKAEDPESVLNAGTRLWKGGCTQPAIRMFEWALKNEPVCRGAAAYNLGAIAESQGNLKMAFRYYQWAVGENAKLQAEAQSNPSLSAAISKSLGIFPSGYIENAIADVKQKLLRGDVGWHGWTQPKSYPQSWGSEICPLCAISRTTAEYKWGESELR
jgi:hypothetical protein